MERRRDRPVWARFEPYPAGVSAPSWRTSTGRGIQNACVDAHLPRLLEIAAARTTGAIGAAALVAPAQVAARLVEFGALRVLHPLVSARLAALLHPIGVGGRTPSS